MNESNKVHVKNSLRHYWRILTTLVVMWFIFTLIAVFKDKFFILPAFLCGGTVVFVTYKLSPAGLVLSLSDEWVEIKEQISHYF